MPAPPALLELINKFDHNLEEHTSIAFNEDTAKSQFIEPFFELLGWDVNNRAESPRPGGTCFVNIPFPAVPLGKPRTISSRLEKPRSLSLKQKSRPSTSSPIRMRRSRSEVTDGIQSSRSGFLLIFSSSRFTIAGSAQKRAIRPKSEGCAFISTRTMLSIGTIFQTSFPARPLRGDSLTSLWNPKRPRKGPSR